MLTRVCAILAVALLTSAPMAKAAPIAQYNPATGGIYFSGVTGSSLVDLASLATPPLILANAVGPNPAALSVGTGGIVWRSTAPSSNVSFGADFFGGNVVPIGTSAGQLSFRYLTTGDRSPVPGQVVEIPEPTGVAIAGSGLLVAIGLVRRRRA
jgi:hypothetical protein